MNIRIRGITDEKILFSLKKVTNSFYHESEFVNEHPDLDIGFELYSESGFITVLASTRHIQVKEQRPNTQTMNKRYAILGAYYQILSQVTEKSLPYGLLNGIRPTKLVHKYLQQGVDLEEVNIILRKQYYVSGEKANLLCEVAANQLNRIPDLYQLKNQMSIYINIPYCPSRCSYCSFTAYKVGNKYVSVTDYLETLSEEIKQLGQLIHREHLDVTTIYIGGGTPTSLSVTELERLLRVISHHIPIKTLREFTVEAGRPDSISKEKLIVLKNYGVDRISINPQTFNDETLKLIGRHHNSQEIKSTFQMAREIGHRNINMDLIIGLPNETSNTVMNSVRETIELNPESITVHTLALKKSSKLRQNYDMTTLERQGEIHDMHQTLKDELNETVYKPYYLYRQKNILGNLENIGYAKDDFFSLYNIIIMEEVQNIIGLGCGSSSKFLTGKTILSPKDLKSYIKTSENYFKKKQATLIESINAEKGSEQNE